MELSEDDLIAAIRRLLSGDAPGVLVGPGDDAAVVEGSAAAQVLTTDMLLEGIHFERDSIAPHDLGAKAIVVNLSDLAAMGASPRYALISIGLPLDVDAAWVVELYGGLLAACDEYAVSLVGGDTNRAERVTLSVTVTGEVAPARMATRAGAHPGDLVVVTGSLGAAAAGLVLSRRSPSTLGESLRASWGRELLDALQRPVARVGEGKTLAQAGVTAMMDLSDGLARDLYRLCAESGVGARVELARIPVSEAVVESAPVLGVDALELAVTGGEDYELLATIDATAFDRARGELDERFGVTLTDVGVIIDEGYVALHPDGREAPLEPRGWDHFTADDG
jgi:thiamine-monophosphate kinase